MERYYHVVNCQGSSREIGEQWGNGCKEMYSHVLEKYFELLMTSYSVTKRELLHKAMKFFPAVKHYDPHFIKILEGQAKVLNVSFEEVFFQRCVGELQAYYDSCSSSSNLCTTFAATGKATLGGITIIGQTIDFTPIDLQLLRFTHNNGLEQLVISLSNIVEYILSSFGYGMCINLTKREQDHNFCLPIGCYMHKVMRQNDLRHAMKILTKAVGGLQYYQLADAHGKIYGIESVPGDYEILYPKDDMLFHTNHYITRRFQEGDIAPEYIPDSYTRLERIKELAYKHYGHITPEILMKMFSDHAGYPSSICHHSNNSEDSNTLASYIMVPEARTVYIAFGNPCTSEYIPYKL